VVRAAAWILATGLLALAGCRQDMHDQPRYEAYEASAFFKDGRASRPPVPGTVARGHLREDALLHTGRVGAAFAETFPFPVTREVLARGRERYDIYCSPCHDRVGTGRGMIVQRGYKQPSSFHVERLRALPPGYFFQVVTQGFGVMPGYAAQVPPRDRWAIVAYVRALQLSQHAAVADLPPGERARLAAAGAPASAGEGAAAPPAATGALP
jgi:mono/diheme cytochrome c family protein